MNAQELVNLFGLGNKFKNQGDKTTALKIWGDIINADPNMGVFGAARINTAEIYRQEGNLKAEHTHLVGFLNTPLTPVTAELVGGIKARIGELDKKMNPQPQSGQSQGTPVVLPA